MAGSTEQLKLALAELLVETIKINMVGLDPYFSNNGGGPFAGLAESDIYQNIRAESTPDGIKIIIPSYFIFIENGRSKNTPYPPPYKVILNWINSKISKGQFRLNPGSDVNSAAYAIRYSIWKNGIRARPFIENSFNEFFNNNQSIDEILNLFFDTEIISLINQFVTNINDV